MNQEEPTLSFRTKPPLGTLVNPHHPLAKDLRACWVMNEGCGRRIFDSTLNKNNSDDFVGAVTWESSSRGRCVDLTGDSGVYISVPHSDSLDITGNQLTLSAIIRPEGYPPVGAIVGKPEAGGGAPIFMGSSAGSMTQTKPSAASAIVRVVGYGGRNSNVMWFDPDNTWIEV